MESLATRDTQALAAPATSSTDSILAVLQSAVERGMDVSAIEKLTALYERLDARRAESEFAEAHAQFQEACPIVEKTSTAAFKGVSYNYAELDEIVKTIRQVCARFGLSYSWTSKVDGGTLTCTCTLRHRGGFSTASSFSAPIDGTAAMSGPQKNASALTFAKRQSLVQVLGIITGDPDTDARQPEHVQTITEEQAMSLDCLIDDAKVDRAKVLAAYGIERIADLPASQYTDVVRRLEARRKGGA